jgi:uncharacterized RDD family membrane protein YckC
VSDASPVEPGAEPMADGLASPSLRVLARLIDWAGWFLVSVAVTSFVFGGVDDVGEAGAGNFLAALLTLAIVVAYEVWFTAVKGGTLGKLALGLRVATAEGRRVPVGFGPAVLRVLPLLLQLLPGQVGPLVTLIIAAVSFVFLFTDPRRQTVWDKVARTVVVVARRDGGEPVVWSEQQEARP